ncbi:hypothetical protein AYO41_03280 [Verrucomicrobia bacterium SCGC AG-212-E04]|nr:hypothetical protein AYO41_03280 [Verrucomicrobia bacterium SCGC AG-212-E04]
MSELCAAIGAAPRTVQICYREAFGTSLRSALQALRFAGARQDLLASRDQPISVKAVALQWGFMHFGRFSVTYRRWFGEGPSMTLREKRPDRNCPTNPRAPTKTSRSASSGRQMRHVSERPRTGLVLRTAADSNYEVPFRFTGTTEKLTFKLGPSQLLAAEQRMNHELIGRRADL